MTILCALVTVFIVVLAARAVLSWFPVRPGTTLAHVNSILIDLTEPVLAPCGASSRRPGCSICRSWSSS